MTPDSKELLRRRTTPDLFEPIADIFALLSVVMIVAVVIYGASNSLASGDALDVATQSVPRAAGDVSPLPDGVVVLAPGTDAEGPVLRVLSSGRDQRLYQVADGVGPALAIERGELLLARATLIVVPEDRSDRLAAIVLDIIDWLEEAGVEGVRVDSP